MTGEWLLQLRERKERESDLDLVLCHANSLCQLHAFLQTWGFALVKKFLCLEVLFLGIPNAYLLLALWRIGSIFLVTVFVGFRESMECSKPELPGEHEGGWGHGFIG